MVVCVTLRTNDHSFLRWGRARKRGRRCVTHIVMGLGEALTQATDQEPLTGFLTSKHAAAPLTADTQPLP